MDLHFKCASFITDYTPFAMFTFGSLSRCVMHMKLHEEAFVIHGYGNLHGGMRGD